MVIAFYIAAAVALASTALAITRPNAVHALLYLVVSLFAVAVDFFVLGAPFVAALEVIVYAGAIMVVFLFVVMLVGFGRRAEARERRWMTGRAWLGAAVLVAALLAELGYLIARGTFAAQPTPEVSVGTVASSLMGPYLLGVEMASMLLLAGLVGAFHVGRPDTARERRGAGQDARGPESERGHAAGRQSGHAHEEAA